jgi:hypothetical protein
VETNLGIASDQAGWLGLYFGHAPALIHSRRKRRDWMVSLLAMVNSHVAKGLRERLCVDSQRSIVSLKLRLAGLAFALSTSEAGAGIHWGPLRIISSDLLLLWGRPGLICGERMTDEGSLEPSPFLTASRSYNILRHGITIPITAYPSKVVRLR